MREKIKEIFTYIQKQSKNTILVLFLLFILLSFAIKSFDFITKLDLQVSSNLQAILSKFPVSIPIFISDFGYEQYMLIPLIIAGFVLFFWKKFKEILVLILATEVSYLLALFIKNIIQRPRPPFELHLIKETGFSFVSGHSTVGTCFYGLLILFTLKYIKTSWVKYLLIIFFSVIILLVGISRVWLGVHYLTDVLGGFLLGSILVLIVSRITSNTF